MRILALETSGLSGSVALLNGDEIVATGSVPAGERTARYLAPTIATALQSAGWESKGVELVAVTVGPGSFTGLRIGVTTAKTFAYAVGCQVLGVHTLLAIAEQVPADVQRGWAVLDAQRQQLFAQRFARSAEGLIARDGETILMGQDQWLASLTADDAVTGPALVELSPMIPAAVRRAPESAWWPTAAAVGRLAWREFSAGRRDDVFQLVPNYYRRTAAEEQWERLGRP